MRTCTHLQISMALRETREPGFNDKAWSKKKRASYMPARGRHSGWENTAKARHNGGYHFFGPGWLLPRVMETVTGSIVWGIYGKMADVPEY